MVYLLLQVLWFYTNNFICNCLVLWFSTNNCICNCLEFCGFILTTVRVIVASFILTTVYVIVTSFIILYQQLHLELFKSFVVLY